MSVFIPFVLSCVYAEAFRLAEPLSKESYQLCIGKGTETEAKKTVEPLIIIIIIIGQFNVETKEKRRYFFSTNCTQ
jgi:hypothetical protein